MLEARPSRAAAQQELFRALGGLAQGEECFRQSLADRARRFFENQLLIVVEEILPQAMKQIREVTEETGAIQNRELDAPCFVVPCGRVFPPFLMNHVGCYEPELRS